MTEGRPIERLPVPDEVILPLSQHLGAPSRPVVSVGDRVYRGQLLAEAGGFVSVPLHASVTGTVKAIEKRHHPAGHLSEAIVIATDLASPQTLYNERAIDWENAQPQDLIKMIQDGGFVGQGGAAFPTHVKLSIPDGKRVQFFFVNGAECEPYLTSDHRIMLEYADALFLGIRIIQKILNTDKIFIGVEANKWDAISSLQDRIPGDLPCEVVPLRVKYPQGAEKMLVKSVVKREIPAGKLPIDAQVLIQNVGTIAGIGDLFAYGQPLIERVVTVTGPGIKHPTTLMVPLGAKLVEVLDFCGGLTDDTKLVLFGGPMMGAPQQNFDAPVLKGTSGILCLTEGQVEYRREYACIRCANCLDACPMFLNPSALGMLARVGRYDEMLNLHLLDCFECGSCSYTCPSNIPLVQRFRIAKGILREKQAREKAETK